MWFLLIIGFPIVEIYLLFKVGAVIGLANTFFYLLASAVFGIGLIRAQGIFLLRNLQSTLAQGQMPANALLHSVLIFLSGAFFTFPGFISDLIGLLLLLPGSRHLVAVLMKRKLAQKMKEGSIRFAAGGFGPSGFSANFGRETMRDVSPLEIDSSPNGEVIDITPSKKD
jgi:UPF0716 protein FxsA